MMSAQEARNMTHLNVATASEYILGACDGLITRAVKKGQNHVVYMASEPLTDRGEYTLVGQRVIRTFLDLGYKVGIEDFKIDISWAEDVKTTGESVV